MPYKSLRGALLEGMQARLRGEREIPRDMGLSRGLCGIWGVSGILKSKAGRLWANQESRVLGARANM